MEAELASVLRGPGVRALYQPIVDLDAGAVVAFEALARGPAGSPLQAPDRLLHAARTAGRLAEVDLRCRQAALDGAGALHGTGAALFINVEPHTLSAPDAHEVFERERGTDLPIVLEITERALTERPGELIAAAARARAAGLAIALDDVGADDGSLALLPFLAPDIIKLDLRLVQDRPGPDIARWISAALAESERSGARVLAEGIETPAHLARARALGADLGQGYLFGRPGPLADWPRPTPWPADRRRPPTAEGSTPFEVVAGHRPVRPSTKPMLVELSKHIEARAEGLTGPGVLLAAFQDRQHFTPSSRVRYQRLADRCCLVAAVGIDLAEEPAPGVRGASIAHDSPLRDEWSVLVVGPHDAAALVARDLGDTGPEHLRRFDYAITHDRNLVVAAAHPLLALL